MTRIRQSSPKAAATPVKHAEKPKASSAATAAPRKEKTPHEVNDIWSALSTPTPAAERGRHHGVDLNHLSKDQRESLKKCDAVVASLQAWATANQHRLPEDLQGLKAKDIKVEWSMDFPFVGVTLHGRPLTDRHLETAALRKVLPRNLQQVPLGEVSPY